MRFQQTPELSSIASEISELQDVDSQIYCTCEVYSCKVAASEKKLSKSLEEGLLAQSGSYADDIFGPLTESTGRKVFINLIHTLNMTFPDFDFTFLTPDSFIRELDLSMVMAYILNQVESIPNGAVLLRQLIETLSMSIQITECEVYSLPATDLFGDEPLWGFIFLFFNPRSRQIAVLSCRAVPSRGAQGDDNLMFEMDW